MMFARRPPCAPARRPTPTARLNAVLGLLAVLGGLVIPAEARAQPTGCSVLAGTGQVRSFSTPSGRVTHMSTPRLRCLDGRYMQSDSLVHYEVSGYSNMIGRVLFRTDGRELEAETAQYRATAVFVIVRLAPGDPARA